MHQGAAIRALQGAIESPDQACVMRMMAASMLLSTFEVRNDICSYIPIITVTN